MPAGPFQKEKAGHRGQDSGIARLSGSQTRWARWKGGYVGPGGCVPGCGYVSQMLGDEGPLQFNQRELAKLDIEAAKLQAASLQ